MKVNQAHDAQILAGITHQALAAGELPTRLKLLNWGENPTSRGPVVVSEKTFAAIESQRAGQAYKRLLIDFDHQSERAAQTFIPSPRKHVGYGDIVCLKDDGIYLDNIEYTPAGREFAREYSDISPTVKFFEGSREVAFVSSVALCPNGAVHDLTFLSADAAARETLSAETEEMRKLIEQIAALNAAIKALADELKAVKEENAFLRQANEDLVKKLDATVIGLRAEAAKAIQAAEDVERRTLLDGAARDGKVLPLSADQRAAIPLSDLREMVALARPGRVPLAARTPAQVQDREAAPRKTEISRMCGVA